VAGILHSIDEAGTHAMPYEAEARPDHEIQEEVLAELHWDPRVRSDEISVTVHDGAVTLKGSVNSLMKRFAAEAAAYRVRGVKSVTDQLQVRLPSAAERSDEEIAAAVSIALGSSAVLGTEPIEASVVDGVVTLRGSVEWNFERDDAERVIGGLWGVRGVTNLLEVRARPLIAGLKQGIRAALARTGDPSAPPIQIETRGGTVVLRGNVRSWADRAEAERVAWGAPGVTTVDNRLEVTHQDQGAPDEAPPPPTSDPDSLRTDSR
jgi:osmotically-inducible protein OsmY